MPLIYYWYGLALIDNHSHDIHAFYVDLHLRAREYRKKVQAINKAKVLLGKKVQQGDCVEMNNFQNPQVRRVGSSSISRRRAD